MLILHLWWSLHVCDIHTVFIDCMANTDCIFVLLTASMMLHVHVSDVITKYLWYSFHSHDAHSTSVTFAACLCCSLHCQRCSLYSCGVHCLSLIFRSWARSNSFCQTQCSLGCRPFLWESNTTFKHLAWCPHTDTRRHRNQRRWSSKLQNVPSFYLFLTNCLPSWSILDIQYISHFQNTTVKFTVDVRSMTVQVCQCVMNDNCIFKVCHEWSVCSQEQQSALILSQHKLAFCLQHKFVSLQNRCSVTITVQYRYYKQPTQCVESITLKIVDVNTGRQNSTRQAVTEPDKRELTDHFQTSLQMTRLSLAHGRYLHCQTTHWHHDKDCTEWRLVIPFCRQKAASSLKQRAELLHVGCCLHGLLVLQSSKMKHKWYKYNLIYT